MAATYVLIHGAGDVGWYWHLVEAQLRVLGHDVVAMDLPVDDDSAGLSDYADVVVAAIGDRDDLVVVAQSFGGYIAPIVCERIPVRLLVLVAAMIPAPGESAEEMFANTGYERAEQSGSSELETFYHDVAPKLAAEALSKGRRQSQTPSKEPCAGRVARRSDALPALSPRPPLFPDVAPSHRARASRDCARRNRQRSHARAQPSTRADPAA